jgi:hypothetical protein
MYIWRGKNRRDKRNLLLSGEAQWGPSKEARNHASEDEMLRYEGEKKHVGYFTFKIELLMQQYLDTTEGKIEVDLVMKEIKKNKAVNSAFRNFGDLDTDQQAVMKKNIYEIYRMFSVDYSPKINREGLKALLAHLNMKVPEKGFDLYCRKLNLTEMNLLIDFEVWYNRKLDIVDVPWSFSNSRFRRSTG